MSQISAEPRGKSIAQAKDLLNLRGKYTTQAKDLLNLRGKSTAQAKDLRNLRDLREIKTTAQPL